MTAQGTPPDDAQTTGDQARTELNRRVFRASHSRIPEIVEPARKIRRHGPDILRTTELGCSNARLEASDNRIKVTIRMAYGFHHANNPIASSCSAAADRHTPTTTKNSTHEKQKLHMYWTFLRREEV
ncbi:MAG: transposase [Collinsella sp.]